MIKEKILKDTVGTMTKEEIGSFVFLMDSTVVVTVIATVEEQGICSEAELEEKGIWSEAELEAKEVKKWLDELSETCTLKFVHVSAEGVNKIWKVE